MSEDAIWIAEHEVVELMSLGEAIEALEHGLVLEARGEAHNMAKTHMLWAAGNTLHAIGAAMPGAGLVGTKTWAHTSGGACPLLLLFNSETGALRAVIEAFALGQMRTGSMSGVATRWLAAKDADEMAIVGTGKQALTQMAAVHAVRPLRRLRVHSPRAASRAAFIEKVRELFDFEVVDAASVAAAAADAPIVTLVTRAREPFLTASMLARGTHLNAVGAIAPERCEFTQDVFERADQVVVDSVDSVRRLSREFIDRFETGGGSWGNVQPVATVVAGREGRKAGTDVSLFKAMGMGISDVALGAEILARARAAGLGRQVPQPVKAQPRLR